MDKPKKEKRVFTKAQKNIAIVIVAIIMITAIVSLTLWGGFYFQYGNDIKIENAEAKNIILMVGDGMGFNHLEATKIYKRLESLNMESLDIHGSVRTRSLSLTPTDSAASATALATGSKVRNREIGVRGKKNYENIFEIAKKKGKKVGFVTTTNAYDATIAAFSSHVRNRKMYDEIIKQQVNSDIDVIIGLGRSKYDKYEDKINTEDRAYCKTIKDIKDTIGLKKRIFGILDANEIAEIGESSLAEIVDYARRSLENENGFVLLVEGANIDKFSHSNKITNMADELYAFDRAVSKLYTFADENKDTFLIVTADHETGNLKIPNAEKATIENMQNKNWFKSKSHTSEDVPYFVMGPGSDELAGYNVLDNTDIFSVCKQLIENNMSTKLPLAA